MKRNRKKSSTHEKARPSTSAKLREEHDLAYYVHDRVGLMREVFSILKPKEIKSIYPECVRKLSIDDLEELCLEELLGISSKRLCAILDGAAPPSDTDSSSSSESSSSSDSEKSKPSPTAVVEEVICLDSASNDGSAKSNKKKKKKKKKKKRKRKSTENATSSDATADSQPTEQTQIQQILQTPLNNKKTTDAAILNKSDAKKRNKNKTSTKAAILDKIGAKSGELFSERVAKSNEASRAAERAGMSALEILEVRARARAVRALLRKEARDASQAGPSSSTSANNTMMKEEDSDSEVEIKEPAPEVVDLLSSSEDEDEEKPRLEDMKLEIEVVKEPDPPPNATKTNDKTKVKRSKIANHKPLETKTTENTTKTITPLEINNTVTPASKKRKKDKPNIANRVDTVNTKANDSIILTKPKEKLLNSKNKLQITETVVSNTVNESIKQEEQERESSPDLIMLEDSESEKTTHEGIKKLPENPKTTQNNDSVQSVLKVIDAPRTTKVSKINQRNFTITVTQNDQRKVTKDRNNVVISFPNDANAIDPERDGNSFFVSTQQKHKRDRSSDIIEQSAKKLNSTVTKIIKEKSKGKYLKSVIQKPSDKDRNTRSNRKDKDEKSVDRNKDRYKTKEKDNESDGDEITLQLSDSEKMDLLEDLNRLNLNIVSEHSDHDTKSSNSDSSGSSSDETELTDQQTANSDQVIIENKFANDTGDERDLNQETTDKNLSSTNEIAGSNNKDCNINKTQADNTNITTQNDDAGRDSLANNASNLMTVPKSIINCQENELRQPVKNILRNLRVDEMVLDLDTPKKSVKISENNDLTSNVHKTAETITKESNFKEVNPVTNNIPSESNLNSKNTESNVDVISKNKDCYPAANENNSNVIEICLIRDIPILPDYESDSEPNLVKKPNTQILREVTVDKDIPQETNSKSRKKKLIKLNRNIRDSSSSDDIVKCSDASLIEVKEKEFEKDSPISKPSSQYTECTKQMDDLQCINTAVNLESQTSLQDEDKTKNPINEQTIYTISDMQSQKLTNKQDNETDILTNENQSHTDDETNEICNYTNTTSVPIINDGGETIEGYGKATGGDGKITGVGNRTIDGDSKTIEGSDSVKTSDDDGADKIKNLVENEKDNKKKASDDSTVAIQDDGVMEGIVADTANSEEEIQSNDVVEQAELEEGEIEDDHKRQVSEEGEITTDTESDIEAQDVLPVTICISDEECTTDNGHSKTAEKNDTKKSKKKNLCKKCKRKKALQKKDDRNFRKSVSESKSIKRDKVIACDELPRDKVLATDELPADVAETNKPTINNDISQANKILNDTTAVVIDNISLDSETDSESDSNTYDSSTVNKTDKNILDIVLSSPNNQQTDSDTLETLEISDDSSDCYEILSKEPTTEEIEALSEKIDRIDRVEVVTQEEIIKYELSSDSNETSINEIIKSSENQNAIAKIDETHNESHNSHENSTEVLPDENISWRDRYMKSKKVTRVLTTSHILNALRKKNLDLKRKMLESKIAKPVEEIKVVVEVVPETVEIGSIEHYNTLESSTKYVDPVPEPTRHTIHEPEIKDTQLTNEPEVAKTNETETLVNTTTETQIVTKEMKKEAKQLYKMYKKLVKYNNMFKEKDPNKKKKKKKSKKKDGDASCTSAVMENV